MVSTTEEDHENEQEDIWSILPSYHMFRSTVSLSVFDVGDDTDDEESYFPPLYSPSLSESLTAESTRALSVVNQRLLPAKYNVTNNMASMKNYTHSEVSLQFAVDIQFTRTIGEIGKPDELVDISSCSFKPGSTVNGFFTFRNSSDLPVKFDNLYVMLEGTITMGTTRKKFLEMMDMSASWAFGRINRLLYESNHSNDWSNINDSDGIQLAIGPVRIIKPKTTYKHYFTFVLPQRLLDTACSSQCTSHCAMPSSLKSEDCTISYNVSARFISTNSRVLGTAKDPEYVIFKEACKEINVVSASYEEEEGQLEKLEQRGRYEIERGQHLRLQAARNVLSIPLEHNRASREHKEDSLGDDEITKLALFPIRNGLFASKASMKISTPRKSYSVRPGNSGQIAIPLTVSSSSKPKPNLKQIGIQIEAVTVKNPTCAIPIEVLHKFLIRELDAGRTPIVSMFSKMRQELDQLEMSVEEFQTDNSLRKTLKLLLSTTVDIKTFDVESNLNSTSLETVNSGFRQNLVLSGNLGAKSCGNLPPTFQTCNICRFYILVVSVNQAAKLRLPLVVQNR